MTARAGRARLGAILGQAGAGEQTLLKRLVKRRPSLFAGLVVCFDRNFPGHELILAILAAGGHVIARVKEGIPLPFEDGPGRGWLPDGSRMTWLNAPSGKKQTGSPSAPPSTTSSCPPATGSKSRRRPARSSPPCWTTRKPPLTRSATPTSPGGAPPRPRSARTRPRSRRREPHQRPGPAVRPATATCPRCTSCRWVRTETEALITLFVRPTSYIHIVTHANVTRTDDLSGIYSAIFVLGRGSVFCTHLPRERDPKIPCTKHADTKRRSLPIACKVRGFDFDRTCSSLGLEYIECHGNPAGHMRNSGQAVRPGPTPLEVSPDNPSHQAVAQGGAEEPHCYPEAADIGQICHFDVEVRLLLGKIVGKDAVSCPTPTQGRICPGGGMIKCRFHVHPARASYDLDRHASGGAQHCIAGRKLPVLVADALEAMPSSAYYSEIRGMHDPATGSTWGRVIELEVGGSIPRPQGETGGVNAPAVAATQPEHSLLRHWMPWLIPLLAIALPMLYFIVAASIPTAAWRWGEAGTSLGRGDFLIPVLILCLEAMRRWWSEVKCGWKMGIVRFFSSALCLGAVVVCSDSFSVATSHVVTTQSTKSVSVITWGCFAVGFLSGTIAVWASAPRAGKS